MRSILLSLFAGIVTTVVIGAVIQMADHADAARDCQRFTRELKILQACSQLSGCRMAPVDLRHMDSLQTSCQALGK